MGEPVSVLGSTSIEWHLFAVERPEPGLPVLIEGEFGALVEARMIPSLDGASWRIGTHYRPTTDEDVWAYRPEIPKAQVLTWR